MRSLMMLAASAAILAGCNTVRGVASDINSVADAFDPGRTYAVCGTYGLVDRNGDARISRAEWLAYGPAQFASWDMNHNGRISQGEFANCWYGGGFVGTYNRANWQPAFGALDVNHDGVITRNEFFSAAAWTALDPSGSGYVAAWPWS